ncbi:MAG: Ubiquinone/menaquinone biosynthesis C-methyltransferase UbiE [Candidatus Heimdallarchaeota archaeon LC_2]|nr:MAG: Ubiquinone/menaquinone biosynthesis C-methyltransferase UbiE [Candidatus Heimdallarchaeota archaeon LC_2]
MNNNGLYSFLGRFYDILDHPSELLHYRPMRKKWIVPLRNEKILEVGVGTGKNLPYYHHTNEVVGLDREKNMLMHAIHRIKNKKVKANVKLTLQKSVPWKLSKTQFSQIVATFVFCTMDNPTQVLTELSKWVEEGTKLLIFEYIRPSNTKMQYIVNMVNPLTTKLFGVNFDRKPTHQYFDDKWRIIRRTDIVKDFIIVIEAVRT